MKVRSLHFCRTAKSKSRANFPFLFLSFRLPIEGEKERDKLFPLRFDPFPNSNSISSKSITRRRFFLKQCVFFSTISGCVHPPRTTELTRGSNSEGFSRANL